MSGNSSGGLLATWLAANRPSLVRAVVLEDPPLFSAEQPRIRDTIAYRSFTTSHQAVQDGVGDFLLYWIDSNSGFIDKHVAPGAAVALTQAIRSFRKANPGEPIEIGLVGNDTVRQLLRGLDEYDPRFGAAFYDGSFHRGFDHAETLGRITCPVLLLHANTEIMPNSLLNGAMSQEEADRAVSLLGDVTYRRIDATHVVHLAEPDQFAEVLERFFNQESRAAERPR